MSVSMCESIERRVRGMDRDISAGTRVNLLPDGGAVGRGYRLDDRAPRKVASLLEGK